MSGIWGIAVMPIAMGNLLDLFGTTATTKLSQSPALLIDTSHWPGLAHPSLTNYWPEEQNYLSWFRSVSMWQGGWRRPMLCSCQRGKGQGDPLGRHPVGPSWTLLPRSPTLIDSKLARDSLPYG